MQNRGASCPTSGHRRIGSYRPSAAPAIVAATGSTEVGKGRGDRGDAGEMLTTGGDEGEPPKSWPAADAHGGDGRRPVLTVAAVLRCVSGVGEKLRRRGSARRSSRWRHFPPTDGDRGESTRTTGGCPADDGWRLGAPAVSRRHEGGEARGEAHVGLYPSPL
jgi:hypothetical protein